MVKQWPAGRIAASTDTGGVGGTRAGRRAEAWPISGAPSNSKADACKVPSHASPASGTGAPVTARRSDLRRGSVRRSWRQGRRVTESFCWNCVDRTVGRRARLHGAGPINRGGRPYRWQRGCDLLEPSLLAPRPLAPHGVDGCTPLARGGSEAG